jgi:Acetyltransferase (GNAT) domain
VEKPEQTVKWQEEVLSSREAIEALARSARDSFSALDPSQDLTWLHARSNDERRLYVLSARRNGSLLGLAPFEIHPSTLRFGLGELTLARKRIRRFALEGAPAVADGSPETLSACFELLAARMPKAGGIFLRGVSEKSVLHPLLNEPGGPIHSWFHVIPHGPTYLRCRINWNGNFEDYLNSLGKVSRKDLRRTLRKAAASTSAFRLQRYCNEADVAPFLEIAARVSARTYQQQLLDEGIHNSEQEKKELLTAARMGRFLGHILFSDQEPIAFHLGAVHDTCFHMVDGGYDPDWAKMQVGILTFLLVLKDLEQHRTPVETLDYLYGGGTFKERTSNTTVPERHYYLFRRDAAGTALASAMFASDNLSRLIGEFLARYRLKEFVKRQIRRISSLSLRGRRLLQVDLGATGLTTTWWATATSPFL